MLAKPIVEKTVEKLKLEIASLVKKTSRPPHMVVVLVGNNPASLSYIKNKQKLCEQVGAKFTLKNFDEQISEKEFLTEIKNLNLDENVDGFIIQMPVSKKLGHLDLGNLIAPNKDIDGFNFQNVSKIYNGDSLSILQPCTPKGIIKLLDFYNIEIASKNICILGRSTIVGKPLAHLFLNKNATVTICHSKTKNIESLTQNADIIVCAIGKAKFLNEKYLNKSKTQVIVDVGINKIDDKICGDADYENIQSLTHAITPVPGGVGPMTVLSLIENLINAYKTKVNKNV